jgi:putative transposase
LRGGWYHVFARGLDGLSILGEDRDRAHLLELFEASVDRYRLEIHSFVLMDSHYHLVLRTPDANLSRAMQWLNLSFAAALPTGRWPVALRAAL